MSLEASQDLKQASPPGGRLQGPLLQDQGWFLPEASSSAENLKERGHVCGIHPHQASHPHHDIKLHPLSPSPDVTRAESLPVGCM